MSARQQGLIPITWPLVGGLLCTTFVAAFVCAPPVHPLRSWTQVVSLATMYLLAAGAVHSLAVWGICRVRDESEGAGWRAVWFVVYVAWIAVVWLPLIAMLTAEHSPWVALVLPLTAIFATLLLKWQAMRNATSPQYEDEVERPALFDLREAPALWRVLLPATGTALAFELGGVIAGAGHAWTGGCLFGAAVIYPLGRWLGRAGLREDGSVDRAWARTSAGNSAVVWLLLMLALMPFMAAYVASGMQSLLGVPARTFPALKPPSLVHAQHSGYSGIILVQPRKPHEIVAPSVATADSNPSDPKVIPFDGAYWYFKSEGATADARTRITQGDPIKNHIFSTDGEALVMEARQPLRRPLPVVCCRTLRVDVTNADNVPGRIALEVLLRGTNSKTSGLSLGTLVLPSSAVSPMPLHRAPVGETLRFALPASARGRSFTEIMVRIKPERTRALAGAQIAIKDFSLER